VNTRSTRIVVFATLAAVSAATAAAAAAENKGSFYKKPVLFNFSGPNETTAVQSIDRFGPVGISITLRLPPFQMYIKQVEEGSPAEMRPETPRFRLPAARRTERINCHCLVNNPGLYSPNE